CIHALLPWDRHPAGGSNPAAFPRTNVDGRQNIPAPPVGPGCLGGLTEAGYRCHVAAAVGATGAVGIGGSSPTGGSLSPSAVRWGNGGGGGGLATGGGSSRKASKVCAGLGSMAPPVKAMVNALGHCRGCIPPHLDAMWTLPGSRSPRSERA